jgi:hypothetical protein
VIDIILVILVAGAHSPLYRTALPRDTEGVREKEVCRGGQSHGAGQKDHTKVRDVDPTK